jgi:hypothetical protein
LSIVLKETGSILLSAFLFYLLFSDVLFQTPANLTVHFLGLFQSGQYSDILLQNLDVYTSDYTGLFEHNAGQYYFGIHYTQALMLALLVIGGINLLLSKPGFQIVVLLAFSATILLFPFSTQGFRYFLPVLPLLIWCIMTGARAIHIPGLYSKHILGVIFMVIILLQYKKDFYQIRDNENSTITPGPFTADNQKVFAYLKTNLPDSVLIACLKPRIVELYTDHRTCVIPLDTNVVQASVKLAVVHTKYLLNLNDMGNKVDQIALYQKDSLIWQNKSARLYIRTN